MAEPRILIPAVVGSNPTTSTITKERFICSHRLTVRTLVFHTSNRGSIPRASTNICRDGGIGRRDRLKICYPFGCVGSIPTLGTN